MLWDQALTKVGAEKMDFVLASGEKCIWKYIAKGLPVYSYNDFDVD